MIECYSQFRPQSEKVDSKISEDLEIMINEVMIHCSVS